MVASPTCPFGAALAARNPYDRDTTAPMDNRPEAPVVIAPTEKHLRGTANEDVRHQLMDTIEGGHRHIVLDLAAVESVDSSFVGVLLLCSRKAGALGSDIRLCNLANQVRTVLVTLQLEGVFPLHETLEEALDCLG